MGKYQQVSTLYAVLIAIFVAVLMIGQAIPRSLVVNNVEKSYENLKARGVSFKVTDGASWDNWTDSYFLNAAVTEYPGNLLEKAIANAHTTISETGENSAHSVIDNIKYAIDADVDIIIKPYSRYWAGMMTIYKILLIFMPINGIRTFVFDIAMILFALSLINVYRLLGLKGVLPYLLSIIISLYIPQSLCLVFSTDIVIMFIMMNICCILLKKGTSANALYTAFFFAGAVLAYLNYWAFPLITLGFPLIFIVTAKLKEHYDIRALTKETVIISFSWGAGLASTVLVKQVLCKIGQRYCFKPIALKENINVFY